MKYKQRKQRIPKLDTNLEKPIFYKSKIRIFDSIYKYLNWYEIVFIVVICFVVLSVIISQIRPLIIGVYDLIAMILYPIVGITVLILLSINLILIIVTYEISKQNKKCQNIFILWTIGIVIFVFSIMAINMTKKEIDDQKSILGI